MYSMLLMVFVELHGNHFMATTPILSSTCNWALGLKSQTANKELAFIFQISVKCDNIHKLCLQMQKLRGSAVKKCFK